MIKLEHLIYGYNIKGISSKIEKEINKDEERAVVIKYNDDTHGSCLLDDEGIVVAIIIFSNCVTKKNKTIEHQLIHTEQILVIIQKTMELLGNIRQEEANNIMKKLGMFDGTIKEKAVVFLNYVYKINILNGLLSFSMIENDIK